MGVDVFKLELLALATIADRHKTSCLIVLTLPDKRMACCDHDLLFVSRAASNAPLEYKNCLVAKRTI